MKKKRYFGLVFIMCAVLLSAGCQNGGTNSSGSAETDRSAVKKQSTDIREQAYHAFMDAVDENNIGRLKQETGSLNQFRLHLGISSSARNTLNGIWDDYANRKR